MQGSQGLYHIIFLRSTWNVSQDKKLSTLTQMSVHQIFIEGHIIYYVLIILLLFASGF